MHFKSASVAAAVLGLASAAEKRTSQGAAVIEHQFVGSYTSTIYATSTSTVIACGPDVTNCPSNVFTSIIPATVTVCPYTSTSLETVSGTGGSQSGPQATVTHFTTEIVTATPTESAPTGSGVSSFTMPSETFTSSLTGSTADAMSTSSVESSSTTTLTAVTTSVVTSTSTLTSFVTVPSSASGPATSTVDSGPPFSTNSVGAIGQTGTGIPAASTNGTLAAPTLTPTTSIPPYVGAAQGVNGLQGGLIGLLIAGAALLL